MIRNNLKTNVLIFILFGFCNHGFTQVITRDNLSTFVFGLGRSINGIPHNGSGSLIIHNDSLYLLTATHVAEIMDDSSYVFFEGKDNRLRTYKFSVFTFGQKWVFHNNADMAIIRVVVEDTFMKSRALKANFFYRQKDAPSRDNELVYAGFPSINKITSDLSVSVFSTHASSRLMIQDRIDTNQKTQMFQTDKPLVQGTSGGPVLDLKYTNSYGIFISGDSPTCYGIVHGAKSDVGGGKIGLVTPSYYLFDLLKY